MEANPGEGNISVPGGKENNNSGGQMPEVGDRKDLFFLKSDFLVSGLQGS